MLSEKNKKLLIELSMGILGTLLILFVVVRLTKPSVKYFCRYMLEDKQIGGKEEPITVEATTAKYETVYKRLQSIGRIKATSVVALKSSLPTTMIKKILFREGDFVNEGDPLILFDDEEARGRLDEKKASLELSKSKYLTSKRLFEQKVEPKSKFDEAEKQYEAAKGSYEQARANLEKCVLRAPFSGTIGIMEDATEGSVVQNNQYLVTLANDSRVNLYVKFPSKDIDYIGLGQEMTLKVDAYPKKIFKGFVKAVDSKVNAESGTILVLVEIDNKDRELKDGMWGAAELTIGKQEKVFAVPDSSIVRIGTEEDYMFIVNKQGKALRVRVIKGHSIDTRKVLEKDSELKEGDIYINVFKTGLTDGVPVRIKVLDGKEQNKPKGN